MTPISPIPPIPASQAWDVWQVAGDREPFLVLVDFGDDGGLQGEFITDYFWHDLSWCENCPDEEDYDRVMNLWHEVQRCCHQAETLIALAPNYDHATRLYNQHLQGMTRLLTELKHEMLKCGIVFAK